MTTLPTFAECAAVPPEKRNALERFICEWSPSLYGPKFLRQLTAVIEEERKERADIIDALLNHCTNPECADCGRIVCPHHDMMHFHHDGCPSCEVSDE